MTTTDEDFIEKAKRMRQQARPVRRPRVRLATAEWHQALWPQEELRHKGVNFYGFNARVLKRGRTLPELKAITRRWLLRFTGLTFALWLIAISLLGPNPDLLVIMFWALGILFVATLLDKFYFDFIGLTAGLDSVSKDFTEARWDLICVSDASMVEYIRAKQVVVQIRAWRTFLAVLGLRLSVVVQCVLWIFISPLFVDWEGSSVYDLRLNSIMDFFVLVVVVISVSIIFAVYLLEPRWRLRALAAASVRSSAYTEDTTGGLLRIGGAFLRLTAVQIATGMIIAVVSGFSGGFLGVLFNDSTTPFVLLWVAYLLFVSWIIRITYVNFARQRLNEAFTALIRRGGSI